MSKRYNYVIGDVQGCFEALKALLKEIRFDPDQDFYGLQVIWLRVAKTRWAHYALLKNWLIVVLRSNCFRQS